MSSNYHQEEPNISEELSTLDQESSETTSNSSRRLLSESQSHNRKPRVRCGECEPCLREDCGTCVYCLKKKKFGGNGRAKNACKYRRCIHLLNRTPFSLSSKENRKKRNKRKYTIEETASDMGKPSTSTRIKLKINVSSTPRFMYGKPVPRSTKKENEKCAECLGSRDDEAKDEPVLLCDGIGCMREYHLSCVKPPIAEVPEGEFYCIDCSEHGTTSNLIRYFDECDDLRDLVTSSKEYVQTLLHETLEATIQFEEKAATESTKVLEESIPTDTECDKNVVDLVQVSSTSNDSKEKEFSTSKEEAVADSKVEEKRILLDMAPKSEILRIKKMYHDMMNDNKFSNAISKKKHIKASVLKSTKSEILPDIGPEFLVGKPLRLFNQNENAYHNGRIMDWRLARSYCRNQESSINVNDSYYGYGEISKCEFFVRFPAGMNGRKTPLHRWIILEEHCVAVSIGLVWALRDKGRGVAGWRPAQVILRSSCELISIRKLLHEGPKNNWSLVGFFGDDDYSYVNLQDSTVDFFSSSSFHSYRNAKLNLKPTEEKQVCGQNEAVDIAISLLMIEREEQMRVLEWYKLPFKNRANPRALTIMDESVLEPLLVGSFHQNKRTRMANFSKEIIRPKLCPLIERGLDRLWIASLVEDDHYTNSIDTISSFTASCIDSQKKPSMIAKLREQRKRI